jgi:hypothetical protein
MAPCTSLAHCEIDLMTFTAQNGSIPKAFTVDRNRAAGNCRLQELFDGLSDSPAIIELVRDPEERELLC